MLTQSFATSDLFEGNGSTGFEHPALYRLAESVIESQLAIPIEENRAGLPAGKIATRGPVATMPRVRYGVSLRPSG